jgi:hypothetical protein
VAQGEVRGDLPLTALAELAVGAFLACVLGWAGEAGYPLGERLEQAARLVSDALAPRA